MGIGLHTEKADLLIAFQTSRYGCRLECGHSPLRPDHASQSMSRLHADIALLFAAAVWGVAFLFQKSAMDHIGPLAFIAARGAVAALALAPLALRRSPARAEKRQRRLLEDRRSGRRGILHRRLAAAGRHRDRHRHQHGLPHRALRGHHAVHRLGLERQGAEPSRVAGGGPVGASAPGCSAAARSAPSPTATGWSPCRRSSGRRTWW